MPCGVLNPLLHPAVNTAIVRSDETYRHLRDLNKANEAMS
jgi:hypothetical protein